MLRKESMNLRAVSNGMLLSITHQSGNPHLSALEWIFNAIYIIFSVYFGIALLALPWMNAWEDNYFLYIFPQIRPVVTNSFFKGAVLGLGFVNILIGIHEIVRIRKASKGRPPE
jgi:hypothetical protein